MSAFGTPPPCCDTRSLGLEFSWQPRSPGLREQPLLVGLDLGIIDGDLLGLLSRLPADPRWSP